MKDVKAALSGMLGRYVGVGVSDPRDLTEDLWPEEEVAMARALPKRRAEFAGGRRAARAAMVELGLTPAAIRHADDRAPLWPQGLTGSIAHSEDCCIAAVAETDDLRSLGIDLEPATALDRDLVKTICTKAEQDWAAGQVDPGIAAKKVFCAKEAIYKAQYPLTGQVIGFEAVTLHIARDKFTIAGHQSLPDMKGSLLIHGGLILAVAYV